MEINLHELARALEQSDVRQGYVDLEKGEVILLRDDMDEAEAEAHVFEIEEDWEHYLPLPNLLDEREREFMLSFAENAREGVRERLQEALQGAGASTRFRHQVKRLLLQKAWEEYFRQSMLEAAREFCQENDLAYKE
ncbi:UPF0158 family protein [Selenomonas sp. AB3002]|uniref:UPF0158 family protein n=1 Tax=Selenomonas sp. AB3002 TaxID=1392502 RepID=UPI000495866D